MVQAIFHMNFADDKKAFLAPLAFCQMAFSGKPGVPLGVGF
jgi:hypothetical protein